MITCPTIPSWIRSYNYGGYTNIFSLLPSCSRLYATETLFGDWGAEVLFLAKDAAPTQVITDLIAREGGKAWRHAQQAMKDKNGWRANENLEKLAKRIPGAKLYGSVTANMLYDDPNWSRSLPGFKKGELHDYLKRVLFWVVTNMPNIRVIACLGEEAWYLTANLLDENESARQWRYYRDYNKNISGMVANKPIIATAHYHPSARISHLDKEKGWGNLEKILSDN